MLSRILKLLSPSKPARRKKAKRPAAKTMIQPERRSPPCAHNGLLPPIEFQDGKSYRICPECEEHFEHPAPEVVA